MTIKRRDFISLSALAATGAVASLSSCKSESEKKVSETPSTLKKMTDGVQPISLTERQSRVAKAQQLLRSNNMAALLIDCGTSLEYFTGITWWPSERTMVAIIPANGDVSYVCPGFEEDRLREQIIIGKNVVAWQEDESPYKAIVSIFTSLGISTGSIGIEERARFFIVDGIRKEAPQLNYVSGDPVTVACRLIKSPAELALMQLASNITLAAIKHSVGNLKEGMSQRELGSMISKAQNEMGGSSDGALVLFGKASAFPHGTKEPQTLKKGDIVLMDCGCSVEGYVSDITRTVVFGAAPTQRQQEIWDLEKKAQAAGFAAAKIGAACGDVDAAARKVITDAGFGPGYKTPGLPHRTGHGIGMDGHEWGNMVKGNKLLLQPGMCFSIEPTIVLTGEFGVRFEDCVYMTETGPKWFTEPSKSLVEPFV